MDRAGDDFLAGAALAGDEDADGGGGNAACEGHHLAHVAGDDGAAVVGLDVFDGPQREAFLALGASALAVVHRGQENRDRVEGRGRFDIRLGIQEELHGAVAVDADGDAFDAARRCCRGRCFAAAGEQVYLSAVVARDGCRASNALGFGEHIDDLGREQFWPGGVEHQR